MISPQFSSHVLTVAPDETMPLIKRLAVVLAGVVLVAGLFAWTSGGQAQDSMRIAAVVNDDAISMLDVFERMQIVLVTANLEDNEETRRRLLPQILRTLIDELLQRQEGERLEITVSDEEIKAATDFIEDTIGLQRGQLDAFLDYNNVSREAFMRQITTELIWNKLIQQRMRADSVTPDEVTDALERLEASADEPAFLLAEIFVAVDDPNRETEVLANLERLAEAIRGGARFSAIAQQFSQSASSAAGGDLGWISQNQLPEDIRDIVTELTPIAMTEPIRVVGGYKLILVRDRRVGFASNNLEAELVLRQFLLPVGDGDDEDAIAEQASQIAGTLTVCEDFDAALGDLTTAQITAPTSVKMNELQPALIDVVSGLPVNTPSPPMRSERGFHVVMVCERIESDGGLPSRREIYIQLEDEQLDLVSRGYLRDLRRSAFIDVRL